MEKSKQGGLAAIGAILIVVMTLFVFGGVKLTDFTTQLAVGLTLLCPAILFFMFKSEVDSWMSRHKQKTSFQSAISYESVENVAENDGSQIIYEHLKEKIFEQLVSYQLETTHDYPLSSLKLNYDLSTIKNNSDYDEAKVHWQKDLPKSVKNPEQLESEIKKLNDDVEEFFKKTIPEQVRYSDWGPVALSNESAIPPLNYASIPNIIDRLRIDWIVGKSSESYEHYEHEKYDIEGLVVAHIEPQFEERVRRVLANLRSRYTIKQGIQNFLDRRQELLDDYKTLQKELNDKVISKIERQQYKTKCDRCES